MPGDVEETADEGSGTFCVDGGVSFRFFSFPFSRRDITRVKGCTAWSEPRSQAGVWRTTGTAFEELVAAIYCWRITTVAHSQVPDLSCEAS